MRSLWNELVNLLRAIKLLPDIIGERLIRAMKEFLKAIEDGERQKREGFQE